MEQIKPNGVLFDFFMNREGDGLETRGWDGHRGEAEAGWGQPGGEEHPFTPGSPAIVREQQVLGAH